MRSTEERVATVKQRIAQHARKKALQRSRILAIVTTGASFALILWIASIMPDLSARVMDSNYTKFQTAASIFSDTSSLGYVVIGLISFALGICVTIICYRTHLLQRQDRESENSQENGDDRTH